MTLLSQSNNLRRSPINVENFVATVFASFSVRYLVTALSMLVI